jgi:hypothetical protein
MGELYSGWPLVVTWLLVTAVAAVFFFVPLDRLIG